MDDSAGNKNVSASLSGLSVSAFEQKVADGWQLDRADRCKSFFCQAGIESSRTERPLHVALLRNLFLGWGCLLPVQGQNTCPLFHMVIVIGSMAS